MLRYSPRNKNSIWSLQNRAKAEELLRLGKMAEAGIAAIEEAKKNGNWDNAYTNRTVVTIPEISKKH